MQLDCLSVLTCNQRMCLCNIALTKLFYTRNFKVAAATFRLAWLVQYCSLNRNIVNQTINFKLLTVVKYQIIYFIQSERLNQRSFA